jgi:hypothetical protein
MRGRFFIFVKCARDDPGQPRNYDAYHKTRGEAMCEAARSSPPEGCSYDIVPS